MPAVRKTSNSPHCTMRKDKRRLLLLTQDRRLLEDSKAALENESRHLVEVRDTGMLTPMLDRGADLVIIDLSLPLKSLEACAVELNAHRNLPVLVLYAVSAEDWHRVSPGNPLEEILETPFAPELIQDAVERLLERGRFLGGQDFVGRSPLIQELRESILQIASAPITVLLIGESGVGKDAVAYALHRYSQRRDRPFKPINCAAIPENLLENELFGHEKGAFTDAKAQYRGIFEQADGGTVFLDEIGEMSLMAQVRLLRVLEQREVTRIGGHNPISVDIRVIAATNKDLQQAVSQREFRLDLYHRLKVVELEIPPLRRRPQDIPQLIQHFLTQLSPKKGPRFEGFSSSAMDLLLEYDWPGNVRELRNLVEHLIFLGPRGKVEPGDLLSHLEKPSAVHRQLPVPTNKTVDQSERELIYFALLDLKREVSELRHIMEERSLEAAPPPAAEPIYPLEDAAFAAAEPEKAPPTPSSALSGRTLKDLEKEAIEHALDQVGGNRKRAAQALGIGVRTLYRKLDEYGLK